MLGWVGNIEHLTLENTNFRTVVFTAGHTQLTLMRLAPGEDIGREVHPHLDQFLRLEAGTARVEFGRTEERSRRPTTLRRTGRSSFPRACGTTWSTPARTR